MQFSSEQIAAMLGGRLVGNGRVQVSDVAPLEQARQHQLAFLTDSKYLPLLATTEAGVLLLTESLLTDADARPSRADQAWVLVPNARGAMAELLKAVSEVLNPLRRGVEQPCFIAEGVEVPEDAYIGAFAYVGKGARLGRGVQIYPQCYVGDNVHVGDHSILYAGTRVYAGCRIGNDCILHAGCVIGADGFGFEPDAEGVNQKVPQIGNVVIEDDVEIGANTTIDRAMMGSTIVRRNAKLDNLVQIGHNVEVGQSDFLCAQVGIAGSTKVGHHCVLAGQVGVAGHLEIADGCIFGAKSGVAGSVRKQGTYQGSPIQDAMGWRRSMVGVKQLPELMRRVNELEKQQSQS